MIFIIICLAGHVASQKVFDHAYNGYMKYGYPSDELEPLSCTPKDPKLGQDVMGNFTLSLIDSLTTTLTMRKPKKFIYAMQMLKLENFNINSTISIFEVTIRVLGALTSTALLLEDNQFMNWLTNDTAIYSKAVQFKPLLIRLSIDLGNRLLLAFNTSTGIPPSKTNLMYGLPVFNLTGSIKSTNLPSSHRTTNPAAAGTLLLEFGMLSILSNNKTYYNYAKRALLASFHTHTKLGLFGNEINIDGHLINHYHSIGGGIDSLYEYLLKGYLVFHDDTLLDLFLISYQQLNTYNAYKSQKKYYYNFNKQCYQVRMPSTFHLSTHALNGRLLMGRISGLAAFFPGMQILFGDTSMAFLHLLIYIRLLEVYPFVPEAYSISSQNVEFNMYLLRPEVYESMVFVANAFIESRPIFHSIMEESIDRLNYYCKTKCGYASLKNLLMGIKDPRMESYFLSETTKYMYLMFHQNHYFLKEKYTFTTEGHPIKITNWASSKSMYPLYHLRHDNVIFAKKYLQCPIVQNPYVSLMNKTYNAFEAFLIEKKIRKLVRKSYKRILFDS